MQAANDNYFLSYLHEVLRILGGNPIFLASDGSRDR